MAAGLRGGDGQLVAPRRALSVWGKRRGAPEGRHDAAVASRNWLVPHTLFALMSAEHIRLGACFWLLEFETCRVFYGVYAARV